jgi:hypothetical protein
MRAGDSIFHPRSPKARDRGHSHLGLESEPGPGAPDAGPGPEGLFDLIRFQGVETPCPLRRCPGPYAAALLSPPVPCFLRNRLSTILDARGRFDLPSPVPEGEGPGAQSSLYGMGALTGGTILLVWKVLLDRGHNHLGLEGAPGPGGTRRKARA